jgi:hypothetical protein
MSNGDECASGNDECAQQRKFQAMIPLVLQKLRTRIQKMSIVRTLYLSVYQLTSEKICTKFSKVSGDTGGFYFLLSVFCISVICFILIQ